MAVRFDRMLPGELEGKVNPETYGFEVIDDELPSPEEQKRRVADLYQLSKEISGIMSPHFEELVDQVRVPVADEETHPADDPLEERG